jgi:hypothetical protein
MSEPPSSSSRRRRRFPSLPTPNPASKSFPSLLGAPSGYISRARAPLRFHLAL